MTLTKTNLIVPMRVGPGRAEHSNASFVGYFTTVLLASTPIYKLVEEVQCNGGGGGIRGSGDTVKHV